MLSGALMPRRSPRSVPSEYNYSARSYHARHEQAEHTEARPNPRHDGRGHGASRYLPSDRGQQEHDCKAAGGRGPRLFRVPRPRVGGSACKRVQVDEIWSFVGAKAKNVRPEDKRLGRGDVWTWTAICADSKLVPSWFVGNRDSAHAMQFMHDLAGRLGNRVQLTSDGHKAYLDAVDAAFGADVDYAMLVKLYGNPPADPEAHRRYSPSPCIGAKRDAITGDPDPEHISTSYVERQNLNIRMGLRRFTRLTNAFSKKMENHVYALSIYFMHYNFARVHSAHLTCSPKTQPDEARVRSPVEGSDDEGKQVHGRADHWHSAGA